jgi:hypothetical protein
MPLLQSVNTVFPNVVDMHILSILPRIECPDDEVAARAAILSAVADGSLSPGERWNGQLGGPG